MKILLGGDIKENDKSAMKYIDILSQVLFQMDNIDNPTVFTFRKGLKTAQGVHNNTDTLNEEDFEQVQCTVGFYFSMDLPATNKARKSAG